MARVGAVVRLPVAAVAAVSLLSGCGSDCWENTCSAVGQVLCQMNEVYYRSCKSLLMQCERNSFDRNLISPIGIQCFSQADCDRDAAGQRVSCEPQPDTNLKYCVCL